ncbi:hypothetical protein LX64_01345 [Chitinophaga skermanii]|uniref:DUF4303 domain-containing protein n=1 Tax=Chitinophaga skermanii TaxID=331697 RepID=A0A327QWI6_9BACT|nr:DUF4303 domain-containing protein [Chitinophaga skermanii]RAJ08691.1 hypothetical protein LX64_01345 [Chitinophaga skermanii]
MTAQAYFASQAYADLKLAIEQIPAADLPGIYALSLYYYAQDDEARYPMLVLGYNTLQQVEAQTPKASSETEAKWNYAFWLQNQLTTVGGENDGALSTWFESSEYYYSIEDEAAAEEDDALFDQLVEKANGFNDAFIDITIQLVQQLFSEQVIATKFGQNIPVIIHELEYYDKPLQWTATANPPGLADEFIEVYKQ